MAATIAIESNWGEVLGKRWAGDVKGFFTGANPSTGIANITPGRAMTLFNDANCETSLYYHRAFRSPISIWPFLPEWEAATDFFEEQEWLALPTLDVEYAEDGYTPIPTHRRSADVIYGRLQNTAYSLDLLAANLVKGAEQSTDAGLVPSVFNIANYHWFGAWQSAEELHAGTEPWKHGIHGVRIVRNFDTAAEKLGLSVRLTSLPGQLESYYSGVHPVDLQSVPPFLKTEQDWANVFANTID